MVGEDNGGASRGVVDVGAKEGRLLTRNRDEMEGMLMLELEDSRLVPLRIPNGWKRELDEVRAIEGGLIESAGARGDLGGRFTLETDAVRSSSC